MRIIAVEEGGVTMGDEPCEERTQGRGQEVPPERADYILPGVWRCMLEEDQGIREELSVRGRMTIQHPWFSGLREAMEYFCVNVEAEKKARIVIDYDPQKKATEIIFYSAKEKPNRVEVE